MSKDISFSKTVGKIVRYKSEKDYKNGNFYNETKIKSKNEGEKQWKK